MITLNPLVATAAFMTAIVCAGCSKTQSRAQADTASASSGMPKGGQQTTRIYYLEIVTKEVDAVCGAYAAANGAKFSEPDVALGNARTAPMPGGGLVGVRAPLRETEAPVVRPYWLVDDIEAAVAAAVKAGGVIAVPPMRIPGHGTFAIYIQGGVDHGFWQKELRPGM
jgi:predicted enzyme related to lactoylglutathione lyase